MEKMNVLLILKTIRFIYDLHTLILRIPEASLRDLPQTSPLPYPVPLFVLSSFFPSKFTAFSSALSSLGIILSSGPWKMI
jgi:hypothetical protein